MKANRWDDIRRRALETTLFEEVLSAGFLEPFGMTLDGLAERLGVSVEVAYEIMVGTRAITREMSVRLASVFKTSPEFWVSLENGRARTRI